MSQDANTDRDLLDGSTEVAIEPVEAEQSEAETVNDDEGDSGSTDGE
jgi:hypothetical protein